MDLDGNLSSHLGLQDFGTPFTILPTILTATLPAKKHFPDPIVSRDNSFHNSLNML
jgi:hypothetical protein